jgi:aryl-alcohol dehydrogenase-like predicted oxidoreductase
MSLAGLFSLEVPGLTPGAVAIAWVLRDPAVTAAIVGARRPGQLREICAAADFRLAPEEIAAIEVGGQGAG